MPIVKQYLAHLLHRKEISVFHPDYIVAEGMGVYAGIKERSADVKDLLLTDVCPFSLGTNVVNKQNKGKDLSSFIIMRNSPLPISKTSVFYPSYEQQSVVDFKIFQGEEMYADENKRIGFIPIRFPKPASTKTRIDVTFTYDINGILLVNVDVPDYNIHEEKVFLDDEEGVSNAKVKSVVNKLKEYKALSEKDEDNRLVMEWGKRLYAQMPPGMTPSFVF